MRRLYLRIYFAVLASLAVFAIAAAVLWRTLAEPSEGRDLAIIARNVLAPRDAPPAEQQAALERVARDARIDLALFAPDGTRLAAVGEPLQAPERAGWRHQGGPRGGPYWATQLADGRWLVSRPHHRRGPWFFLFALGLILLAVGVGAYPVARRLTKRLERLQRGVDALGAGELSARVEVKGRDEIAQLAGSFNRAAARIEELVGAHKSLLAHVSHEFRTPLARIRMALELGKDRHEIERDIAELDALIDEVLLASRLDALPSLEVTEEVDVLALAAEEAARYDVEAQGEPFIVRGDPRLLRRMIRNLLENARRHGAAPVDLRVKRGEIRVCDAGPGVPAADRERVFEPFYSKHGVGLGLTLVRQIARRHGGEARCDGSCFHVTLPAG